MSISKHSRTKKITTLGLSSLCLFAATAGAATAEETLAGRNASPLARLLGQTEGFSHKSLMDAISKFSRNGSGTLAMIDEHHNRVGDCVLQHTDVDAKISGYMARVTVTQKFHNSYKDKVEAVYTFPLPDQAAVDSMTMKIGDRVIKGDIKERGEARQIYQNAAAQGYTAALLDQERPNIFTQSVANVEPGADVNVEITYTQVLPFENGQYAFIFPTVVGERFIPAAGQSEGSQGERVKASSIVPDAALITPPVKRRSGHDISMSVSIDGGVPIRNVRSELHDVETQMLATGSIVKLKQQNEIPNRDFILTWDATAASVESGYLAHKTGKDGYVTLMMMPPQRVERSQVAPREMIFVVDCSGSMRGEPIEKCKETMHYVLDQMNERDSFQIIAFNHQCDTLFSEPNQVTSSTRKTAHDFINRLQASGGTYIANAIEKACAIPAKSNRLRIVTMMTDGDVGNEFEAINMVKKLRNKSRWFPFGIGNGSNTLILNKMAEEGGGEAKLITLQTPAKQVVREFYDKISSPVLTDVSVQFEGGDIKDVYPKELSDVWAQKPLYFKARYGRGGKSKVLLKGFSAGKPYTQTLEINLPESETANSSVEQIWARAKVDDLMSRDYLGVQGQTLQPELKKEIISTAVAHHIMTQYTSFVAVDLSHKTATGPVQKVDVPVEPVDGTQGGCDCFTTGNQTMQGGSSSARCMQGATNGTIGPQGCDATVIEGINTAGTIRINNCANLEALANLVANGLEILGLITGIIIMTTGFLAGTSSNSDSTAPESQNSASDLKTKRPILNRFLLGALVAALGLATPGLVNYLTVCVRDMNLFS